MIFKKKIISKTVACARHNSEYVTLMKKKVSAQAYPREYVHLVYLYICAQGVGGGHNTSIETAVFFFVPVPFFLNFFNASSSSQGGFSAHFAQCSYAPEFKGSVERSRPERHFCSLLPYFFLSWLQIFQRCLSFWTSSIHLVFLLKFLQETEKYPKNHQKRLSS